MSESDLWKIDKSEIVSGKGVSYVGWSPVESIVDFDEGVVKKAKSIVK